MLKSFWRSVHPKNFLPRNKPVKMKIISHYIIRIISEEKQENDSFLWKYESLECFSLYAGRKEFSFQKHPEGEDYVQHFYGN